MAADCMGIEFPYARANRMAVDGDKADCAHADYRLWETRSLAGQKKAAHRVRHWNKAIVECYLGLFYQHRNILNIPFLTGFGINYFDVPRPR
jgi:hypothetical protein